MEGQSTRLRLDGPNPSTPDMLDLIAIAWVVLSIVVLASTRANRYLVFATLGSTLLACYFAAGVWMNGALSLAVDDQSAQGHVRAAITFEILTALAMSASAACLISHGGVVLGVARATGWISPQAPCRAVGS